MKKRFESRCQVWDGGGLSLVCVGRKKMMKLNEAVAINGFVLLFYVVVAITENKIGNIYIGLVDH